jgi:hypothetical protein
LVLRIRTNDLLERGRNVGPTNDLDELKNAGPTNDSDELKNAGNQQNNSGNKLGHIRRKQENTPVRKRRPRTISRLRRCLFGGKS